MLAVYFLLTAVLSVVFSIIFTLYCVQRPQQLIWKNKTIKYTNKQFKPRTNQLVRGVVRRRIRELDSSSSSGYEPSTSGEAKGRAGAATSRTRTPPPCYNWRGPEMNDMYQSEEEVPPPPYSSLSRRSSGSSRSSAHTVSLGEDSDERQQLISRGNSSDSE